MILLGVDSGTSVVKAVAFDMRGDEIASARRDMPVIVPGAGRSEVDMTSVWELTAEAIREVVTNIGAEQIGGVAFSGTACGYWGVDEGMRPVRNAILWNDSRAGEIIGNWQISGFYSHIFQRTGNAPFPGYPLSTLRWLADHEPETLERTRWLFFHKDWLRWHLTGDVHGDVSDMSYFPGSLEDRRYDDELLAMAGLDSVSEKLPHLLEPDALAGKVTPAAAEQTGLKTGTPVAAGAVDVVASVLGGGAARAGQACSVLGTSFLNSLIAESPSYTPAETGVQACMPGGLWVRSLVNTAGTINIDWMARALAAQEQDAGDADIYQKFEVLVAKSPVGARGLIFLPYLNNAGIVSPFADPNARGMFFGLSMEHTRADMIRAVYEGTALAMRDCYTISGQPVDEVVLVGGGARSAMWAGMFADATGARILIPHGTEFGARGAAMLAGVAAGAFADYAEASGAMVRIDRVYEPNIANKSRYDALYKLYAHLYQNARDAWAIRAQTLKQLELED